MRLLPAQPGDPVAVAGLPVRGRLQPDDSQVTGQITEALLAGQPELDDGAVVLHRVRPDVPDMLELRWVLRDLLPMLARQPLPGAGLLAWDADSERPWWVRRFMPGVSLADHVRTAGPLAATDLVALADHLAARLGQLHDSGFVHGALRPAHVILGSGPPQLVDLELVLLEQRYGRLTDPSADLWAAPEQAAGHPIGPAADVYGLGCLVGYAASGLPPGVGDPSAGMPQAWASVVRRALSADPQARPPLVAFAGWTSPQEGLAAAQARAEANPSRPGPAAVTRVAVPGLPEPESRVSPRLRNRRALALAAAAGAGVLVLGAWALLGGRSGAPPLTAPTTTQAPATRTGPPDDIVAAAPVPIDATGSWTGSAAEVEGDAVYELALELAGDAQAPRGTISLTNIATGSTAAWEVSGRWRAKQLVLEPGEWLARPDQTWRRSVLTLVALSQGRLTGSTAPPDDPGDPSSNVDLYR